MFMRDGTEKDNRRPTACHEMAFSSNQPTGFSCTTISKNQTMKFPIHPEASVNGQNLRRYNLSFFRVKASQQPKTGKGHHTYVNK